MAAMLPGSNPQASTRTRVLLAICELQQRGAPASFREIQRRLGSSVGSINHHLRSLEQDDMITRADSTRAFTLTPLALGDLLRTGWLEAQHAITVVLTAAAVQLLEFTPEGEGQTPNDAPAPEGFDA